jgi:hypothetical protein
MTTGPVQTAETTLYCYRHPTIATTLRCNRCERPICTQDAILTPTGYRCPECIRSQQKVFNTAVWYDYLLGFGIAFFLSLIASILFGMAGTWLGFFAFFVVIPGGPIAGAIMAEAVRFVINRRRARTLFLTIGVAAALGALPTVLFFLFNFSPYALIFQGIYLFTAIPTLVYRLSGIRIGR